MAISTKKATYWTQLAPDIYSFSGVDQGVHEVGDDEDGDDEADEVVAAHGQGEDHAATSRAR